MTLRKKMENDKKYFDFEKKNKKNQSYTCILYYFNCYSP